LGICRGMQSINVALGGTLTQDIPSKYGTNHRFSGSPESFHHKLTVKEGNMLFETVQKTEIMTNSYHHQAVDELAPGLIPTAYSEEGIIEAFEAPKESGHFIFAVQWHPESTQDEDEISLRIFELFMDAVHRYMTVPCHHHD
ncbi:MAG: gamma-glutamyl-gamma-aminobutyrate hydrolase family protein, partial [Clostridia bacterium]|nr:gamma-glutamyl-gamma-aminobutyrate hydrolase family protein [Clostridia bacterium]